MNKKNLLLICLTVLMLWVECAVAGNVAPDFTLVDIDGVEFSLSDYRGKIVLLNFFSATCSSCIDELPHLKSLHEEFGEDLIIISIGRYYNTLERLQEFRQTYEIDWIICKDTADVSDVYAVPYIPTLVLIDQEGYIQSRHSGVTHASVIRQEIYSRAPAIPGDVDRDYDVDLYDAVRLLVRYGLEEGHSNFDSSCDIDGDGQIFLDDAVMMLSHYGEEYP